jgi:SAM-dependent methyltransferase
MEQRIILPRRSDVRLAALIVQTWLNTNPAFHSLLDVGCGDGVVSNFLPKGSSYQGLDISEASIYRQNHEDQRIQYVSPDDVIPAIRNSPRPDAVFLLDVLEHTVPFTRLFDECLAVANHYVVVSLPNELHWADRLRMLFGKELSTHSLDLIGRPIGFKHQYIVNIAKARVRLKLQADQAGFSLEKEFLCPLLAKQQLLQPALWLMRQLSSDQLWSLASIFVFRK